jgi:hypothetical protein
VGPIPQYHAHSLRTNQERVKSFFRYFHNAGVIAKNPAVAWKRIAGKVEQASGSIAKEYEKIVKVAANTDPKLHAHAVWRPCDH